MTFIRSNATVAVIILALSGSLLVAASARRAGAAPITFADITPDNVGPIVGQAGVATDCPEPCASGHNGGRVNGLAGVPGDANTYFAASEVGGLFKTADGGASWTHLDGYVPSTTWDVAVAPGGQRVYATAFFDGRVDPLTGLQVSKDGGVTWSRPALVAPAGCSAGRAAQPSGFGIALRPGTSEVFVGTNCGIASSTDAGDTWMQFDPTPGDGVANSIWAMVALPGGRTYACGDDGLLTSPDGHANTWQALNKPSPFPGGFCSLAVSPDDPTVVFVVFGSPKSYGEVFSGQGGEFYEGHVDYSGGTPSVTWSIFPTYPDNDPNPVKKQRVPFVVTNKRSSGFDLWLGDGSLWRVPCSSQNNPNCPTDRSQWFGSFTDHLGTVQDAHGDSGDLVFDPTTSVDACPTLYSSDGGIHRNITVMSPACQTPTFRGANVGMHAFLIWDMAGVSRPGEVNEEIYIGTQDNGLYYTGDAGVPDPMTTGPTWIHGVGADLYDLEADATRVVVSTGNRDIVTGDPGFLNMKVVGTGIANRDIDIPEFIAQAGAGRYMMAFSNPFDFPAGTTIPVGVRDTSNIEMNPFGSALGTWPATAKPPCHIRVGVGPSGPQPYVLAGTCLWPRTDFTADELWTYTGGTWMQIPPPPINPGDPVSAGAGFGLIAVDPVDPDRLYASVVRDGPPRLMRSTNGGTAWQYDAKLTDLVSGNGKFMDYPQITGDGIFPYIEPLMVAFDPTDPNIILAGGSYSGIFVSTDDGQNWFLLTDPFTPGTSGIPHLPRPVFAHFDHDKANTVRVYVATGRGVWRIDLASTNLSISKTGFPDPVIAGTALTYTITVTNNGPDAAQDVMVSDAIPAGTTFVSATPSSGGACAAPPVGGSGTVTCSWSGETPPAGVHSAIVVVQVSPSVPQGTIISDLADTTAPNPDTDRIDNSATAMTDVVAEADLAVTKNDTPDPVLPGTNLVYTIDVINNGPSDAISVVFNEAVPANTTFKSLTVPSGWSCVTPPVDGTGTINCATPSMAAGTSASFKIIVRVSSAVLPSTAISNTVTIGSDTTDPNTANSSSTTSTRAYVPVPPAATGGLLVLTLALVALAARSLRVRSAG